MDIVIGAGISGLSYAAFSPGRNCLVLEADRRIGGYCKTTRRSGFVWDCSGHFFHFRNPEIKDFVMAGIHPDLLLTVRKSTRIRYKDRMVDYPFQKNIHQLEKEEFIDCLYDLFNGGGAYGTFKEMLYARFGKSISEKFLCPYNRKLYACDLDLLDKDAMGRFFPYADPVEIVRNFRRKESGAYNDTFIYSKEGAQSFVDSIASHVDPDRIRTGARVVSVDPDKHEVRLASGEILPYERLVSTLPFPRLLDLCGIPYDARVYTANQVLVFNLGFDTKGPMRRTIGSISRRRSTDSTGWAFMTTSWARTGLPSMWNSVSLPGTGSTRRPGCPAFWPTWRPRGSSAGSRTWSTTRRS